ARVDLGTVLLVAVVVALGQCADPSRKAVGRRMLRSDLGDHRVLVLHELGDYLCDRSQAPEVVEGQADHDTAPAFCAFSMKVRIFATASGTDRPDSSPNHARISAGDSSPAI